MRQRSRSRRRFGYLLNGGPTGSSGHANCGSYDKSPPRSMRLLRGGLSSTYSEADSGEIPTPLKTLEPARYAIHYSAVDASRSRGTSLPSALYFG